MSVNNFGSIREALDFLVSRIVSEAKREGIPLSDIERKMLYFSETGWSLPGILEVNKEFERDYDGDEYEAKIEKLIQNFVQRAQAENEDEIDRWNVAIEKLGEGDYYLLAMLDAAPPPVKRRWRWMPILSDFDLYRPVGREPGDRLRLVLTAFACVFGFFALYGLLTWIFGPGWQDYVFPNR
jgi:hypothetical protein